MLGYDKIVAAIQPVIIETIQTLVNQGNIARLKQWLVECDEEIRLREMQKENTYSLYCERYYLQMVIGC